MLKLRTLLLALNLTLPLAAIGVLWAPVHLIFKGPPQLASIGQAPGIPELPETAALKHLRTVMSGAPFVSSEIAPASFIRVADDLLAGKVNLIPLENNFSHPERRTIQLPFDSDLTTQGNSSWQLFYAGFGVPQVLLKAHEATGKSTYLAATRDFILGWHRFERKALGGSIYIWNDHAIASRALVLTDFWYRYRDSSLFDPAQAEEIIALADQTARLLADKRLYTYRTNHGFMQNTGLAKLALTFPLRPGFPDYKALAFSRMNEQLEYLFSPEGIVQEHSPGYHAFGIALLNDMIALTQADGQPEPVRLVKLRGQALDFLDHIVRPDGSLPRIGDTLSDDLRLVGSALPITANATNDGKPFVYPRSGYAVHEMNAGKEAPVPVQFSAFWGYVPYMGHIHANEMSSHLWAGGIDWWTAVGYWPYSRDDRKEAVCWTSSNAPHLEDEACPSATRTSRVLGTAREGAEFMLDMSRTAPGGFEVRRQILSLGGNLVLTLDSFQDASVRPARLIWRTGPNVSVQKVSGNYARLHAEGAPVGLAVELLSSHPAAIKHVHADATSTIGWVMDDRVKPTHTFIQKVPSNASWTLNISMIEPIGTQQFTGGATMMEWSGPEAWQIGMPLNGKNLLIKRIGADIIVNDTAERPVKRLTLATIPHSAQTDENGKAALLATGEKYGKRFDPYMQYRVKLTLVLVALGTLHFIYMFGLKYCSPRIRRIGFWLPVIAWPGLMTWIMAVYLAP